MSLFVDSRKDPDESFVHPGFGVVRRNINKLWTVVGSSVAITIFDRELKMGGLTHYTRPRRESPKISNAFYAAPAIIWLLRQFDALGSQRHNLEAQLIGGAWCDVHPDYIPGIHDENVAVGLEILHKSKVWVSSMDVGGTRGRKVVFNPRNGESAIAKVSNIRETDWYPPVLTGA